MWRCGLGWSVEYEELILRGKIQTLEECPSIALMEALV
jgi:hypothetical protein